MKIFFKNIIIFSHIIGGIMNIKSCVSHVAIFVRFNNKKKIPEFGERDR